MFSAENRDRQLHGCQLDIYILFFFFSHAYLEPTRLSSIIAVNANSYGGDYMSVTSSGVIITGKRIIIAHWTRRQQTIIHFCCLSIWGVSAG